MTNILVNIQFLLSKLFLKHVLSSPLLLRECDVSQHYGERGIRSLNQINTYWSMFITSASVMEINIPNAQA